MKEAIEYKGGDNGRLGDWKVKEDERRKGRMGGTYGRPASLRRQGTARLPRG
jgi:hypothetical protein